MIGISSRITRCNSTTSTYLLLTILRCITRVRKYIQTSVKLLHKSSHLQSQAQNNLVGCSSLLTIFPFENLA